MKTSISISGQISGNIRLANAIKTYDSEMQSTMFNGYKITFNRGGISYSKYGTLNYDASVARIEGSN